MRGGAGTRAAFGPMGLLGSAYVLTGLRWIEVDGSLFGERSVGLPCRVGGQCAVVRFQEFGQGTDLQQGLLTGGLGVAQGNGQHR